MSGIEPPQRSFDDKPNEDKRLERLYDYTKFHIGIYLSAAGGVAALLGTKEAGWVISTLIGNQYLLYAAFALLVLAGMCGGVVATSITESRSFPEFWEHEHSPATVRSCRATGKVWVAREHGFFWASLLVLAASILVRYPGPPDPQQSLRANEQSNCCCDCSAAPPASAARP
jgi:MFS family permease